MFLLVLFLIPEDNNATAVTVTFHVGTTLVPVPIAIVDDDIHEDPEYFVLTLSTSDLDVQLGPHCLVEINDNDRKFAEHVIQITTKLPYILYIPLI